MAGRDCEPSVELKENTLTLTLSNQSVLEIDDEKHLSTQFYARKIEEKLPHMLDVGARQRLEERVKALCKKVKHAYAKQKGRSKASFLLKTHYITVTIPSPTIQSAENVNVAPLEDEFIPDQGSGSVHELLADKADDSNTVKEVVSKLGREVEKLKQRCDLLEKEKAALQSTLEVHEGTLNYGKKMGEGCKKTDCRKLIAAGASIDDAVNDLLSSFGLNLHDIFVSDLKGLLHKITYLDEGRVSVQHAANRLYGGCGKISYSDLDPSDQQMVRDIAVLLDEHAVSNTFWQQLCRTVKYLPSVKLLDSYRETLTIHIEIFKTPGNAKGAQVSFLRDLETAIKEIAADEKKTLTDISAQHLVIKIEGDGCKVSKKTSWTTLSFVVIRSDKQLQSPRWHRLLAVVETHECYFAIRESFRSLISEINDMIKKEKIILEGVTFRVKVCLGADLKFILLALGLQSASSNFPCPFCIADANERTNIDLEITHFNAPPIARTRDNMKSDCDELKHGVQFSPLFDIEPSAVVPDTLHMTIRICHRLLDALVIELDDLDCQAKVQNPTSKNEHMAKFIALINSLGVRFDVWEDDKKGHAFTTLTGDECKLLLRSIPEKAKGLLHSDTESAVLSLWSIFSDVMTHFEKNATGERVDQKTQQFLKTFLDLGHTSRKGYGKSRITPYIHILTHHASIKHEQFRCLGWYSSQGLEKKKRRFKNPTPRKKQQMERSS